MAEMRSVSDGKDADATRLSIQRADCDAISIRLLADIMVDHMNLDVGWDVRNVLRQSSRNQNKYSVFLIYGLKPSSQ